ncbi:GNAT family N-acetyltransferase [Kaistia dalseonensis]|uniref:Ribosomal protein S18 acetylase RimI-like enzyme n=1 Tax=Kaistia dalseonensis TaxID=410840 RepID=A0ABU0HB79_9HYPH|nr:GNAT family N-acetyltransferase [Kaistia dalseonensis]MCX5496942.1 GNAT family N-acetyltransferase [Kaistia dalseonensis]MDQ0439568.1 ribosomal protein S18 acetylase RimI-like enzyme [Kaistia dalseonensis]
METIRHAVRRDIDAVTALHVTSSRRAYRGIVADAYLDGPLAAERAALWLERITVDPETRNCIILVAETDDRQIAGLICLVPHEDARWGHFINNLHIDPERKGRGIGAALLRAALEKLPVGSLGAPVHLLVYEANHPARAVYDRWGGAVAERIEPAAEGDGKAAPLLRYVWPTAEGLLARIARVAA